MKEKLYILLQVVLIAITLFLFSIFLFGCSPKVVPIIERTDSIRTHIEVRYDSIWQDRWHVIKEKGDTIYIHDSIFIEKWRDRHIRDTVMLTDSIPYKVEVTKEVRKRNGYDRFTSAGFWILLIGILLIIGIRIYLRFKGLK